MNTIDYEIFDAKVEKFLRRLMTAEEETAFKAELTASPELMERARTMALMVKEMKALRKEEDAKVVEEIKGMNEGEFRKAAGLKVKRIPLWPRLAKFAAAACFVGVICTIGLRFHTSSQYKELGNTADFYAYTTELSDASHLRGEVNNKVFNELCTLSENVKQSKDLDFCISRLKSFYEMACAYVPGFYGPPSEAARHRLMAFYHDYIDDIAWTLAFAYLKDGDGKKAIPVLEEMLERNKDYPTIAKPVQELLDKIREI